MHRRFKHSIVGAAAMVAIGVSACGSTTTTGGGTTPGGSSPGGGSTTTSAVTWTHTLCSQLAAYQTALTAEQTTFNNTNPPDAPGLKAQEVTHLQKYLSIVGNIITQLKNGGLPDIPDGQGYVTGFTKSFTTLQTSLNASLAQANALDVTSDPSIFTSDLQGVGTSVNDAFTQQVSDWNAVDPQFTNPGDNPLVRTVNSDPNCGLFLKGAQTPAPSATP